MKKPRLTWRKEPDELGLRSIGQKPRGMELRHAGERLGWAGPKTNWPERAIVGYYCTGRWDEMDVPLINTCNAPVATIEEAKAQLQAHFDQHLALFLASQEAKA